MEEKKTFYDFCKEETEDAKKEIKEATKDKGKVYSTFSLVFGIISFIFNPFFLFSILGILFSNWAIKEDPKEIDNDMRKAGKIMSIVTIVLHVILTLLVIIFFGGLILISLPH